MAYSFRIRINRSPTDTIRYGGGEITFEFPNEKAIISLCNPQSGQPIKDAKELVLHGNGYNSEHEAVAAGERYQNALMVALARVRVGADFGQRAARSAYTENGLKWLEQEHSKRFLNNVHGLMVYQSEPKPRFASVRVAPLRLTDSEVFRKAFQTFVAKQPVLTSRDQLAFSLFNASFFQPTADSRFLLLITAIEALIEPTPRSATAQIHVEALIEATRNSALGKQEKESMLGTLQWLRNESINQAGKRIVSSRLGNRTYKGVSAPEFFTSCYEMRSKLVHGKLPYPTFEQVGNVAATLETFVSDLLTSPFLGSPT